MKQKSRVFLEATSKTPKLYYDMELVEFGYPVLFTCRDDGGQMYIVSCHVANGEKREWLIAGTTPEIMIKMLSNEATIRSTFTVNDTISIVTQYAGIADLGVSIARLCEVPSEILPTENEYMDADDGEFDEEIEELSQRVATGVPINVLSETIYYWNYEETVTVSTSSLADVVSIFRDVGKMGKTKRYRTCAVVGGMA